jgi:hypothetical protein
MGSRSRPYTRNDPGRRFQPVPTAADKAAADELRRALAPATPSDTVRSEAWYGSMRQQERFPQAMVWIGLFAAWLIFMWLV